MTDTTTVREILQQCQEDGVQDRQATLIQGVKVLEPDMTVSEAGLDDGAQISLLWSNLFVEMARWTGEEIGKDLYVRIPPGTTSINFEAFRGCKALVKVVIPDSVTSIGAFAFYGCSSLTEINIPDSVTSIEEMTFCGCSSLTEVQIPTSVTSIAGRAFSNCSSLRHVDIPSSVRDIVPSAFGGCPFVIDGPPLVVPMKST